MVDTDKVKRRALRGIYTGAGAASSGALSNIIQDNITDSRPVVSGAHVALGNAISIGVDRALDQGSMAHEAVEYAGYGVQAVGWDLAAEELGARFGSQTSAHVIDVNANAGSTSQQGSNSGPAGQEQEMTSSSDFSVDV